mmetsp:Transcript_16097/g.28936  ORF Transcript_16097/g.28936 Transcript_16097/m.28936 type:complete len:402 (+) Transcript_16097:136-1341(+)|eukprot:CAMPEP_0197516052 /NCGR_PEP_ID=MMETSP1318-20131121/960_1 /TAXON_ID=552666 /ORGANISM="Partenskyella glossopodia, Strain RCC365" /LENGTH=401 /DNA_ID=CAMNT_0043064561 /DNA_START=102 /DNA_END=1307 /DNA_ORIENTATION=+
MAPRVRTNANNTKKFSSVAEKLTQAEKDLPSLAEIKAAVPKHCFERNPLTGFYYILRDGVVISALGWLAWQLPHENMPLWAMVAWALYAFWQGTALTGWWVIAHECGHGAFSPSQTLNDCVGYVLHTILYVPYFSWQYSHAKHHSKTNHLLDGETHVPATKKGFKLYKAVHSVIGDDAFAALQVVLHLLLGWPMYLVLNATGSRRLNKEFGHKRIPKGEVLDHFRPTSKLFPKSWRFRIFLSSAGLIAWTLVLAIVSQKIGFQRVSLMYVFPYLWTNAWLVLYTWLQHTEETIPHWGEGEGNWTWLKGAALGTIDREYGIFDWFHHHIGSTHVCHHIFSKIPHYHAQEATIHLKKKLGYMYNYNPELWVASMWKVAKTCHYVDGVQGRQFPKSAKKFSKSA